MKFLRKYTTIKDLMTRFTILQIGRLHIRVHSFTGKDETTLLHCHPFHYVSVILCGGYTEQVNGKTVVHKAPCIIARRGSTFHRIDHVLPNTKTLFFALGNFGWQAKPVGNIDKTTDGLHQLDDLWYKRHEGVWYIGHADASTASLETRHSIHQHRPHYNKDKRSVRG